MNKRGVILTFGIILTLICSPMYTAVGQQSADSESDLKIGYVDPQAIMSKMPEMKAVEQRLQNFAERKRQELADKEVDLQEQLRIYEQKAAVISDQAKAKEEERLGQLNAQLQQFRLQIQQELQQKQQELIGPLFQEIEQAIDKVASDMELTYVLNTTTTNGDVIILYASEDAQAKYDITEAVMQNLDM